MLAGEPDAHQAPVKARFEPRWDLCAQVPQWDGKVTEAETCEAGAPFNPMSPRKMPETVKAVGDAAWALVEAVPAGPMHDAALAVAQAALAVVDAAKEHVPAMKSPSSPNAAGIGPTALQQRLTRPTMEFPEAIFESPNKKSGKGLQRRPNSRADSCAKVQQRSSPSRCVAAKSRAGNSQLRPSRSTTQSTTQSTTEVAARQAASPRSGPNRPLEASAWWASGLREKNDHRKIDGTCSVPMPPPPSSARLLLGDKGRQRSTSPYGMRSCRTGASSVPAPPPIVKAANRGAFLVEAMQQDGSWGASLDRPGVVNTSSSGQRRGRTSSVPGLSSAARPFGAGGDRSPSSPVSWMGHNTPASPSGRRSQSRSVPRSPEAHWQQQPGTDASSKTLPSSQEVRDVLNRSAALSERGVYQQAVERQTWEVSQLRINNLPADATSGSLARLCRAFGHQVVDVQTERNLARNCCAGKAKVLLRSSPATASTPELVRFLENRAGCSVKRSD